MTIYAAKPFLEAGAEICKEWVQDKIDAHKEQPKIELPPGVERDWPGRPAPETLSVVLPE
jgi:hypothetical protein